MTSPQRFLTIVFAVAIAAPAGAQAPKELWDQRYDGPSHQWDEAVKVAVDGAGNVFVTGLSGEPNGFDFARYTAKYAAANGMLLWEKRHRSKGANSEWGADLAVDSAGNVVVTGVAEFGDSEPGRDYLTAKYAGVNGALLWQHRYNGPANYNDEAYSVAVDDVGNVIVTGFSWTTNQTYSAYTAKYAAANGGLLWERRGPYASQCFKVVVDGQGNAIVAGLGGFDSPFYTAKYAGADGTLLWERRYEGYGSGLNYASSVAVDRAGNVAVTGSSAYEFTYQWSSDIYTAKYAAADGALLWEQRCHRADRDSRGDAVAMDSAGNVFVAGSVSNDFYTAKYAAANGTILWQKRYRTFDEYVHPGAKDVAVDSGGNAVVTGRSLSGVSAPYTAKYAAADGALIWERRYGADLNGFAIANSLAVGRGFVVLTGGLSFYPENLDYGTVRYLDGPTPQTLAAQVFSANKARVGGSVNPNGFVTSAAFEYGTDPKLAGAATTPAYVIGSGSAAVPIAAILSSLRPQTKYYYRAIGTGSGVTLRGEIMTFTTPPAPTTEGPVARPTPRPMHRR